MTTCVQCGTENRDHARFCLRCGAGLEAMPQNGAAAAAAEATFGGQLPSDDEILTSVEIVQDEQDQLSSAETEAEEADESEAVDQRGSNAEQIPPDHPIALLELPDMNDKGMALVQEETAESEQPEPRALAEPSVIEEPGAGESESVDGLETEPGETKVAVPPRSASLEPGARLADRYEIVALIDETENTLVYDALDHGRCSQCGFADSQLDDIFCAHCGASLEAPRNVPHIPLCELRIEGEAVIQLEDETEGKVERWFEWDGRLYAILPPQEEPEETTPHVSRGVRHIVGYSSDPGLQRELDEDAVLILTLAPTFESRSAPSLGLYAVADGMGGHEGGEIASRLAIEELAQTIMKRLFLPELTGELVLPETPSDLLRESIQSINMRIFELQRTTGSDLGTTLTAALVRDDMALIANVGDSRTYLWRDGHLAQITMDHSLVAQLVEAGALGPEEIYSHPDKSAIYRSLGHAPEVEVDLFEQPIKPGDKLLLCCDGVWEMLRPDGIEDVLLMEPDPQRACQEIVRRANLAGGEDNISSVIVQFEEIVANR